MDTHFTLLMEFMSKILEAVQTRKLQNKRTKDEGSGIVEFAWLGKRISRNKEVVQAAIANDTYMFRLIMEQAIRTLNQYVKTGVWNRVFWISGGREVHFVWTPQDGKKMSPEEENRFKRQIGKAQLSFQRRGYAVTVEILSPLINFSVDGLTEKETEYHLDRNGYYTRGKKKETKEAERVRVWGESGTVFKLLENFFNIYYL
jgi:hypothetical protein